MGTEKRVALFIDRDGTLIAEPPVDFQVDSLEKLEMIPGVMAGLGFIASHLQFELVMVTNQDGLGTPSFPEDTFWLAHNKMLTTLAGEGIEFDDIIIDRTFEHEHKPTRKPGTALLRRYMNGDYDLLRSWVIGDRLTDAKLARNLGCGVILFTDDNDKVRNEIAAEGLSDTVKLVTRSWSRIADFLQGGERKAAVRRVTRETDIDIAVDLDGSGRGNISTGVGFFDHMLDQIAKHSGIDLTVHVKGDLHVDEHHTIEDTALALGEALLKALGDKRGIERYGYVLPMDDCLCTVAIDFGGRPWLVMDAEFRREKIGDFPCEMIFHFFKSLSDAAKMNLFIRAEGANEHHKLEGIFKALARSIKMAIRRDRFNYTLPTTKGTL